MAMGATRLILVGGFLGAGKTTLLARGAEQMARLGKRVGLVTNDQAANLVDTAILERAGSEVREVAGGCFCCRFPDLIAAAEELVARFDPDVLICEPVGSCTDLSATVIQPIKRLYGDRFLVAPYSVLVDPRRAQEAFLVDRPQSPFPDNVLYIFRKQLEEADVIVLNKADLLSSAELAELKASLGDHFPGTPVVALSALRGDGVEAWLDFVGRDNPSGRQIAEVDYDLYAEGEAVLGWLNAVVELRPRDKTDWKSLCLDLVKKVQGELRQRSAEIAHLKLYLTTEAASIRANLTGNQEEPLVQADRGVQSGCGPASLLINARVHLDPGPLRSVVEQCLRSVAGSAVEARITSLESFQPGRPVPTHRIGFVV